MRQYSRKKALALALTVGIAAAPAPVAASGFQLIEQNGSGLGNAYAGQAAGVSDPSAVFYNPAAMTRLKGKHFSLAVSGIGIANGFTDSGTSASPVAYLPKGSAGGDPGGWAPVPNAYLTWELTPSVWFGFGVNAPFGLKTEWQESPWMGRFYGITSDIKTYNFAPTLAYKVNDNLSFGAGASIQRLSATLTRSVPYGLAAYGAAQAKLPAAFVPAFVAANGGTAALLAKEGMAEIDGNKWGFGFNLGALVSLNDDNTHFGINYRSKVKYTLAGTVTFTGAPTFVGPGALAPLAAGLNAGFAPGNVTAEIELPDTLSVAFNHKADKLELMVDWTRTGWSSIQDLTINRDPLPADGLPMSTEALRFQNTWRVGLGVNYQATDNFKLRLGYALDKAPVQDQFRTPRLPDADRNWASVGFQYKVGQNGAVDFGYARIFITEAVSNLSSTGAGKLIGTYNGSVNILSLQFHQSF